MDVARIIFATKVAGGTNEWNICHANSSRMSIGLGFCACGEKTLGLKVSRSLKGGVKHFELWHGWKDRVGQLQSRYGRTTFWSALTLVTINLGKKASSTFWKVRQNRPIFFGIFSEVWYIGISLEVCCKLESQKTCKSRGLIERGNLPL